MRQAYPLGALQWSILAVMLHADGDMTTAEVSEEVGKAPKQVRPRLRSLVARGLVEDVGQRRSPLWRLRKVRR